MTATHHAPTELIEQNQGLVRSIAAKIRRRLPDHVDLEDLISYGQIGLAQSAREFDPSRGVAFSTFAYYRIRGAVYDGISKLSWTSRARYNQLRYQRLANEALSDSSGDSKQDNRAVAPEQDARWLQGVAGKLAVVYLATHRDGATEGTADQLADPAAAAPSEAVALNEVCSKLHELIDTLPSQAARLIRATYFEGLTLQEAGARIGISKSWASRVHSNALDQLARSLKRLGVEGS